MLLLELITPEEFIVKRSPGPTVKSAVGDESPIPTKPLPLMVSLSFVPKTEDEEILNLAASESSIPIVHFSAEPETVLNSMAESAAFLKIVSAWFGAVVPMPTLPLRKMPAYSVPAPAPTSI